MCYLQCRVLQSQVRATTARTTPWTMIGERASSSLGRVPWAASGRRFCMPALDSTCEGLLILTLPRRKRWRESIRRQKRSVVLTTRCSVLVSIIPFTPRTNMHDRRCQPTKKTTHNKINALAVHLLFHLLLLLRHLLRRRHPLLSLATTTDLQ